MAATFASVPGTSVFMRLRTVYSSTPMESNWCAAARPRKGSDVTATEASDDSIKVRRFMPKILHRFAHEPSGKKSFFQLFAPFLQLTPLRGEIFPSGSAQNTYPVTILHVGMETLRPEGLSYIVWRMGMRTWKRVSPGTESKLMVPRILRTMR